MWERNYRVLTPASPAVVAARLRQFLQRDRGLLDAKPFLPPGDPWAVDERSFRFRLVPHGRNLVTLSCSGLLQPSGKETEVSFNLRPGPSGKELGVFGLILAALAVLSAIFLVELWSLAAFLATCATIGGWLLVFGMLSLHLVIGRSRVSRSLTTLFTEGLPEAAPRG